MDAAQDKIAPILQFQQQVTITGEKGVHYILSNDQCNTISLYSFCQSFNLCAKIEKLNETYLEVEV